MGMREISVTLQHHDPFTWRRKGNPGGVFKTYKLSWRLQIQTSPGTRNERPRQIGVIGSVVRCGGQKIDSTLLLKAFQDWWNGSSGRAPV
jgi:hypothetical protein